MNIAIGMTLIFLGVCCMNMAWTIYKTPLYELKQRLDDRSLTMKNYRVSKPYSSINEWVIEKRSCIFWWVFYR